MGVEKVSRLLLQHISLAAGGTLYQQIVDAVKREVSEGRLEPGAPMPSFRILARDLLVSLITVKRAYEDLEREGILHIRPGLGTFVAANGRDVSRLAKMEEARRLIEAGIQEAREAGLSDREIRKMIVPYFK